MAYRTRFSKIASIGFIVCSALCLSNRSLADSQVPTQTTKVEVYFQLSKDDFVRVLSDAGYTPTEAVVQTNGAVRARISMGDIPVQVFLSGTGGDLQLYAGFRGRVTFQAINEWNREQRFSHAYLDKDRDPVIESDLDIRGGVAPYTLKVYLDRFKLSVAKYRSLLARTTA